MIKEPEPKEEKEEDQFAEYKKNQAKKYALRPEPIEIKKVGKDFGTQISTYQIYVWNAIKPNIPFDKIPLDIYETILPFWCPDALDPETFPAQIFLLILFYNNLHLPCTEKSHQCCKDIHLKIFFNTLSNQTKQRLILLSTLARNESLKKKNISLIEISKMEEYKTQGTVIYKFLSQDIKIKPTELLLSLCTHIFHSDENGESKILQSLENTFGKPSLDHAKIDALKIIRESIQKICIPYSLDSDEQKIYKIQ